MALVFALVKISEIRKLDLTDDEIAQSVDKVWVGPSLRNHTSNGNCIKCAVVTARRVYASGLLFRFSEQAYGCIVLASWSKRCFVSEGFF